MGLFGSLFDDNAKDLKKYGRVLTRINELEPDFQAMNDDQLRACTADFRRRLDGGQELKEMLPEAFAAVREAAWRSLGMRHFDVQLIGGMALSDGRIAEMKTGEGKTLVATAPAYLHSLTGQGVHVITVNDYLARRDSQWMGQVYSFLGLTTGLIVHGVDNNGRRAAYNSDITYGTNNEFGFDYLRDNMCFSREAMVQRPLHYCIVDEVDSILVDEARTPLIISGPSDKPADLYYTAAKVVTRLHEEADYTIDLKTRQVALTEEGVAKMEQALGVTNLYDPKNTELSHHINQALRARYIYKRDRDYVVKDNQVIIVDEFTGRLMFGRRYSEGLHQAIEAKENVKIERESQTLATITFQNYFRMYKRLAGMTGTAKTEESEFQKIYGFDVVEIPSNLPNIRQDMPDVIYRTQAGKFNAVVDEIVEMHDQGRPVLVGTISIEKSEQLSRLLSQRGVRHNVLNAKYHELEAEIVSQAGRLGAVTIATNMAGRGTDILLGGNAAALAGAEVPENDQGERDEEKYRQALARCKEQTQAEHDQVVALGGLHIIGTERHESRRIDNQLRGRAGRQGDPGSTRFFLSMEDDLMLRFGGERMAGIMDKLGMDDSMPIDAAMASRSIEQAQKRVEERNFDMRKNVLDYDDVMNQQRELIYSERRKALTEANVHDSVVAMQEAMVEAVLGRYSGLSEFPEEWELTALIADFNSYIPQYLPTEEQLRALSKSEVYELFHSLVAEAYEKKAQSLGEEKLSFLEHAVILRVVDGKWIDHLDAMDDLRTGIGLRAMGQLNPLIEYKREAYDMFQAMVEEIQLDVSRLTLLAELVERPQERQNLSSNRSGAPAKKQPVRKAPGERVGRNEPCPCGSGKKYKNCCGRN